MIGDFMRKILSAVLAFQFISIPVAQAEVRAYLERSSIWTKPTINVDGTDYQQHFFVGFSDLPEAMHSVPEAAEYARLAQQEEIWGSSLWLGGIAAAILYASAKGGSGESWNVGWLLIAAGIIPGAMLRSAGHVNLNKAINAYNGAGQKSSWLPDKFSIGPVASASGANLGWSF
jgi:hypothetical protein